MKKCLFVLFLTIAVGTQPIHPAIAFRLTPSLNIRPELNLHIDSTTTKWLAIGGATVGGIALLYYLYSYFFPVSDVQELQKATLLCSKALKDCDTVLCSHDAKLSLLALPNDEDIPATLKKLVQVNYCYNYPYLACADDLAKAMTTLKSHRDSLIACKARLEKRKTSIMDKSVNEIAGQEQQQRIEQFARQEDAVAQVLEALQATIMNLQQLQRHLMSLPEYTQEKMQHQLDLMEDQLHTIGWNQRYCYKPTNL